MVAVTQIYCSQDVYTIYYQFLKSKHNLQTEQGIFYYFIDAFGLFEAELDNKYRTILMELVIDELDRNQRALQLFSLENLASN